MNRDTLLQRLDDDSTPWDVLIIGGGATGLGAAVEAASRGYRTVLLEQHDFAKGTSSRSTKLIHGGVRYLRQGNVTLVVESLRERGRLLRNAPHLVHNLPFVVPIYDWWEGPFYGVGLKLYDVLAGRAGFPLSEHLSREETLAFLPTLDPTGLRGGVQYYDGQFDDARLAIALAQTAVNLGATVLNYIQVVSLKKEDALVKGVQVREGETGRVITLNARVVINATGIFADQVRRMDDEAAVPMMRHSQGIHLVLDRAFLPTDTAIMIPRTDDRRVLFAIPWHHRTLLGTTDTPTEDVTLEPKPLEEEVEYLLGHAARYLTRPPARKDVLSAFAGIRPLIGETDTLTTASLARDHTLHLAPSGLLTILGGKWTTYRKMAEDAIDQAAAIALLPDAPSMTADWPLFGWYRDVASLGALSVYGSAALPLRQLLEERPELALPLHPRLHYLKGEVVWAVRHEMARTVEDVLARRTRGLFLDARACIEAAPEVAALMAQEMGQEKTWQQKQVADFIDLARGYILEDPPAMSATERP